MSQPQPSTRSVSVPQAFDLARRKHLAGDLDQADKIYRSILNAAPDHAEALTMLASIAFRQGRDEEAVGHVDRAINLVRSMLQRKPDHAQMRASLINLLLARSRTTEAEALMQDLDIPLNPMRSDPQEFEAKRAASQARGLPALVISTLPKSASESIWNKLAQGLGLAQCYLSLGLFPDCTLVPARVARAAEGGVIVKEHIGASAHNLATLAHNGIDRVIVHHRDPRQATLSWTHFARDDINRRLMAPLWRKIVPPAEIMAGDLDRQIDWCIEQYLPFLIGFLDGWRRVERDPARSVTPLFLSFELFRQTPETYFAQALGFFGIDADLFQADAEAEVVHLREGRIDEWREVFTEAQRRRAWELIADDMAEAFGWEP